MTAKPDRGAPGRKAAKPAELGELRRLHTGRGFDPYRRDRSRPHRFGGADQSPAGGMSTPSITWMTPLVQTMSVFTTFTPLTVTLPSLVTMAIDLP